MNKINFEKEKYKSLASIINRGYYRNGKKIEIIDIFKHFNCIDNENFIDSVKKELLKYYSDSSEVYKIIVNYIESYSVGKIYFVDKENLKKFNIYVDSFLVTNSDIDKVFAYMELNGYPKVNFVYCYILREFLYKNLVIDDNNLTLNKSVYFLI